MANINNLNAQDPLSSFARREDDTETHVIAVWNAVPPVRTYIGLQDPNNPGNVSEARDVAEVHRMVGLPVPDAAFQLLNNNLPNIRRRRFFSTQPQSESKRNCRNYGYARDRVCNATNQRWALMCHGAHGLDAHLASQHGIPAAGIVPFIPDHEDLLTEIQNLQQQLVAARGQASGTTNPATNQQLANLQQQLTVANNQVTALTAERDAARRQLAAVAGQTGGTLNPPTAQQLSDLQRQLGTANTQVATVTTERDDARRELVNARNDLTTANAQLARVTTERDTANVEVTRLLAAQSGIRTNLAGQVAHLIEGSPTLQVAGGGVDRFAVAREVADQIDLDRLMGTVTHSPQADQRGGAPPVNQGGGTGLFGGAPPVNQGGGGTDPFGGAGTFGV